MITLLQTYNEFDESYLTTVLSLDTFAVEQYSFVFKRKDWKQFALDTYFDLKSCEQYNHERQ
jgi:hypothetical protein